MLLLVFQVCVLILWALFSRHLKARFFVHCQHGANFKKKKKKISDVCLNELPKHVAVSSARRSENITAGTRRRGGYQNLQASPWHAAGGAGNLLAPVCVLRTWKRTGSNADARAAAVVLSRWDPGACVAHGQTISPS